VSPASPKTGEVVTFNSSCSTNVFARGWDLDDGTAFDDGSTTSVTKTFATAGTYTIRLGVVNRNNVSDIESKSVVIANRPPVAAYTFAPLTPSSGDSVTFTSAATDPDGTIAKSEWDWNNDGTYDATGNTAAHAFATPGSFTVVQRVTDNSGDTNTVIHNVVVANRAPVAAFGFTPAAPQTGQAVAFTSSATDVDGTISKVEWDWSGDGTYDATGATASHAFTTPGTYTVGQRVTDNSGGTATTTKSVAVANQAPTAGFTINPAAPLSNQATTFTSTATDSDGTITKVEWDWNNNGTYDETGNAATHSFAKPGPTTVRQRVTDNSGATTTLSKQFNVGNRAPTADFSWTPTEPVAGDSIRFDSGPSSDSDGTIASIAWDLDNDGQYDDGTGVTSTHVFPTNGNYTVKLRIFDNNGAVNIATKTITVGNKPPVASFTVDPSAPTVGDTVTFTSTATDEGRITAQAWDFDGDGNYDDGSDTTVTHVFDAAGTFPVSLKVTDNNGAQSVATVDVTVGLPPAQTPGDIFDNQNPPVTPPPITVPPTQTLKTLSPFPIIRIRGRTTNTGAKISLLTVKAQNGAIATVKCIGKGCPKKPLTAKIKAKKGKTTATVSFSRMRGNWKAGTVMRVLVSKKGLIGKYTQFTIRKRKAPVRVDSCLMPGSSRPAKCPVAQ
jgi:PKD repeat protein